MFTIRHRARPGHRFTHRAAVAAVAVSLGVLVSAAPASADNGNALNSTGSGNFEMKYTSLASSVTAVASKNTRRDFWTTVKEGTGDLSSCGTGCLSWQSSANDDELWYPQGLAGTLESNWNAPPPQQVIASGWYKRSSPSSDTSVASAIKFMFTDSTGAWKYRHVQLRTGSSSGATSALDAHMGGLAWAGSAIYVADTKQIWRFDTRDMFKDSDQTAFMVPNAKYVNGDTKATRLSSLSTDWSSSPPALVSAEYSATTTDRTDVVRWPLTSGAGLVVSGSVVTSVANYSIDGDSSIEKVQGVASKGGLYYFSGSDGRLDTARVDSKVDRQTNPNWGVVGGSTAIPQDLYLEKDTNRIFGQTEKRTLRRVFWTSSPFPG